MLGGDREDYSFATNVGDTFQEAICQDYVYYLTYNRLDDATMLETESQKPL